MTALLELCTIVGLLPAGGELCDGVGSTACVCVSQQAGVVRVCCASDSPPQDVARFLEEEIDQHVRSVPPAGKGCIRGGNLGLHRNSWEGDEYKCSPPTGSTK